MPRRPPIFDCIGTRGRAQRAYTEPLSVADRRMLADLIDDRCPMSIHALRSQCGRAYVLGRLPQFSAALVEETPRELKAFGQTDAIAELLLTVPDWGCVDVEPNDAVRIGNVLRANMQVGIRYWPTVRYALTADPADLRHPSVRQLTAEDSELLCQADPTLDIADPEALPRIGVAAGAVVDGRLVSIASCIARSARCAEITIATLKEFRNRGLSGAATSIVARQLRAAGQIPVWSTGADNFASRRVATKVGFAEMGRRCFVILLRQQPTNPPSRTTGTGMPRSPASPR